MDQAAFMSLMAVVLTRATERILVVLIGALAIYLGYSLFRQISPARKGANDGEAKIELPGGTSIFLTRIGPGVFFALFGAGLIVFSATKVEFDPWKPPAQVAGGSARPMYSGLGSGDPQLELLVSGTAERGLAPDLVVAKLN